MEPQEGRNHNGRSQGEQEDQSGWMARKQRFKALPERRHLWVIRHERNSERKNKPGNGNL